MIAARVADLTLLLEAGEPHEPTTLGEAAAAVVCTLDRFGEVAAAVVLVAGGLVLTGLASLL